MSGVAKVAATVLGRVPRPRVAASGAAKVAATVPGRVPRPRVAASGERTHRAPGEAVNEASLAPASGVPRHGECALPPTALGQPVGGRGFSRSRRRRRSEGGQAAIELALGTLVFVTVLLFGIHFAEVSFLSLKVQEAALSSAFDATGMRSHSFAPGTNGPSRFFNVDQIRDRAGRTPEERGDQLYRSFDGRTSKLGRPPEVSLALTGARDLKVDCQPAAVALFEPAGSANNIRMVYDNAQDNGREVDGAACTAQARIDLLRVPKSFADQGPGSFFQARHALADRMQVCGIGRARNGACVGALKIVLDDWGFAGQASGEWGDCQLVQRGACANRPYHDSVQRLFQANGAGGGSAASALVEGMVGASPASEGEYWMGFRGEDNRPLGPYQQQIGGESPASWNTSPQLGQYGQAYSVRDQCFLGSRCSTDLFR